MRVKQMEAQTLPLGVTWRTLTPEEGDNLKAGDTVIVHEVGTETRFKGTVRGITAEEVRVVARFGHVLAFDRDDPAFWPDIHPSAERRPLHCEEDDVEYEIVTNAPAGSVPDDEGVEPELFNVLKASQQIADLRRHNEQIANFIQGLPTMAMYEDLKQTVEALRSECAALRKALRKSA